jgi:hypothetical protein
MPDLSLGRLRTILDLGEQVWLDPNALMCDPPCVWLRLPDQRLQSLLKVSGGRLVKSVVDLARIKPCGGMKGSAILVSSPSRY